MKDTLILGLAATYLLVFSMPTQAQDQSPFYIGLKGDRKGRIWFQQWGGHRAWLAT